MLQVNSNNLWWEEGVSMLRWWGFLHQDLVLGQQQRHQLSCRPTCFGWQWSLDRGSHTSRSSGQQWALRPTLGYSLHQLSPEQGSVGKNIPLIIRDRETACQWNWRNWTRLTGLQAASENFIWKLSFASPGMVGVKTMLSLMLSKGPISPDWTWRSEFQTAKGFSFSSDLLF